MQYIGQAWRVASTLMTHDVATTISDEAADAMEAHLQKVDMGMFPRQAVHCVVIAQDINFLCVCVCVCVCIL